MSRPYLEITRSVMAAFGVDRCRDHATATIHVGPGEYYPTEYRVEPDAIVGELPARGGSDGRVVPSASAGSAPDVGAGRCPIRRRPRVDGLHRRPSAAHDTVVMRRRDTPLRGIEVDMADISDLVPTLAVVATQAVTPTRITGVGFIRSKESDRLGRSRRRAGQDRGDGHRRDRMGC